MPTWARIVAAVDIKVRQAGVAQAARGMLCCFLIAYCFKMAKGNQNEVKLVAKPEYDATRAGIQ